MSRRRAGSSDCWPGRVPQSVSDRAHFYFARIGFQRGYLDAASRSLGRIRGPLPGNLEPERRLLAANVLMAQGRFARPPPRSKAWTDGGDWATTHASTWASRWCDPAIHARGRQLLETVGTWTARSDEQFGLA